MKRYYACLLGNWVDITDCTVEDNQKASEYFKNNLAYGKNDKIAKCFEYDYINIQYDNKNYRINPVFIQVVTE